MGIIGLLPFLKSKGLCKPFLGWPAGSSIAIDVPIFAHKFIYAERTYASLEKRFKAFGHDLMAKECKPVFVFDGSKMPLKDQERLKRLVSRNSQMDRSAQKASAVLEALLDSNIEIVVPPVLSNPAEVFEGLLFPTKKEYDLLLQALQSEGFDCRVAVHEAEALCAHLTHTESAWCSLTEDTDALAFGSTRVVFKFMTAEPIVIELEDCLQTLKFTHQQFIDLCAMFGCDFCDNVHRLGPVSAFSLLEKHGSWPEIYTRAKHTWGPKTQESAEVFQSKYSAVTSCFLTRASEVNKNE
jgi:5'-3' exonuclease